METKLRVQAWILDCIRSNSGWIGPSSLDVIQACLAVIDDYSTDFDVERASKVLIKQLITEEEEFLSSLEAVKKKHIEQLENYKKALKKYKKKREEDEEDDD